MWVPWRKKRDVEWQLWKNENGFNDNNVTHAILMDIRAELKHLNATLDCRNFQQIPIILRGIRRKLPMPKSKKKRVDKKK